MPYSQSLIHSDCDSAESIADLDPEDEQLREMLASPLYINGRERDFDSFRKPSEKKVLGKLGVESAQKREANAQRTQADLSRRESFMSSSSREPRVSGKLDAMFSFRQWTNSEHFLGKKRRPVREWRSFCFQICWPVKCLEISSWR